MLSERVKNAAAITALVIAVDFRRHAFSFGISVGVGLCCLAVSLIVRLFPTDGPRFLSNLITTMPTAWLASLVLWVIAVFAVIYLKHPSPAGTAPTPGDGE